MCASMYYHSFMNHLPKPILLDTLRKKDLERIVAALNFTEKPALRDELRALVKAWFASGPNLQRMMHTNSGLWRDMQQAWGVAWSPTRTGKAYFALFRRSPITPRENAVALFALLTLNPDWSYLGGPCGRCGRYYVKQRRSQKVYCSRLCGNAATAMLRTAEQRKAQHRQDIQRAKKALHAWKPGDGDWKKFVSKRTGLSLNFLTRNDAEKHPLGELRQPGRRARLQTSARKPNTKGA
jgi:hypothetical protein